MTPSRRDHNGHKDIRLMMDSDGFRAYRVFSDWSLGDPFAPSTTTARRGRVMSTLLSLVATGVLIALGLWLLGSIVLRVGGAVLAVGGLVSTAATGSPAMAAVTIHGALAWLAGHWLFAVRHHYFSSSLARRVFLQVLPRRLDPTPRWSIPNVPSGQR